MLDEIVLFSNRLRDVVQQYTPDGIASQSPKVPEFLVRDLGAKASGILRLPTPWTVQDFAVISNRVCEAYLIRNEESGLTEVSNIILSGLSRTKANSFLIVRSSAANETLRMRGRYKSVKCEPQILALVAAIKEVLNNFLIESKRITKSSSFSILVHEYLEARSFGHISNERRIGTKRSFLAESWINGDLEPIQTTLQSKKEVPSPSTSSPLLLRADDHLGVLRELARWTHQNIGRVHLEWIISDGKVVVVQCDVESEDPVHGPMHLWKAVSGDFDSSRLKVFTIANASNCSDLRKTKSKLKFQQCGLPIAPLYLLRNTGIFQSLLDGSYPPEVKDDFVELAAYPFIIRIDVVAEGNGDWENLPASGPLRTSEDAKSFLLTNLKSATTRARRLDDLAIVVHHFIPAKAAAWVEAVPETERVRIDAIWGHPDGLQSFPCDTVYISLKEKSQTIFSRYKDEYLDVDSDGLLYRKQNGPQWDIEEVLQQRTTEEITVKTLVVAKHVGRPVRLMWFLGTDSTVNIPKCFPWILVDEDFPVDPFLKGEVHVPMQKMLQTISQNRRLLMGRVRKIENHSDLEVFNSDPSLFDLGGRRVVLRPTADLIRSKSFLKLVADCVQQKQWRVVLEGSSLAHAFYQLKQFGADTEASANYLSEPKRRVFYGKLVRDNIPNSIEAKGEQVDLRKLTKQDLRTALLRKLIEEAFEARSARSSDLLFEELADVLEVIRALANTNQSSIEAVAEIADRKKQKKGGFELGYELLTTGGMGSDPQGSTKYIKIKIEDKLALFSVPLVPPQSSSAHEQVRLQTSENGISIRFLYRNDKLDLQIEFDHEITDESVMERNPFQLELAFEGEKSTDVASPS
jgi:predicted house-cleaning noncanonical NTP pyrophosphatase (MazG superfamily)